MYYSNCFRRIVFGLGLLVSTFSQADQLSVIEKVELSRVRFTIQSALTGEKSEALVTFSGKYSYTDSSKGSPFEMSSLDDETEVLSADGRNIGSVTRLSDRSNHEESRETFKFEEFENKIKGSVEEETRDSKAVLIFFDQYRNTIGKISCVGDGQWEIVTQDSVLPTSLAVTVLMLKSRDSMLAYRWKWVKRGVGGAIAAIGVAGLAYWGKNKWQAPPAAPSQIHPAPDSKTAINLGSAPSVSVSRLPVANGSPLSPSSPSAPAPYPSGSSVLPSRPLVPSSAAPLIVSSSVQPQAPISVTTHIQPSNSGLISLIAPQAGILANAQNSRVVNVAPPSLTSIVNPSVVQKQPDSPESPAAQFQSPKFTKKRSAAGLKEWVNSVEDTDQSGINSDGDDRGDYTLKRFLAEVQGVLSLPHSSVSMEDSVEQVTFDFPLNQVNPTLLADHDLSSNGVIQLELDLHFAEDGVLFDSGFHIKHAGQIEEALTTGFDYFRNDFFSRALFKRENFILEATNFLKTRILNPTQICPFCNHSFSRPRTSVSACATQSCQDEFARRGLGVDAGHWVVKHNERTDVLLSLTRMAVDSASAILSNASQSSQDPASVTRANNLMTPFPDARFTEDGVRKYGKLKLVLDKIPSVRDFAGNKDEYNKALRKAHPDAPWLLQWIISSSKGNPGY